MSAPSLPPTPADEGATRQTVMTVTAVGGGLLLLAMLLAAVMPSDGPTLVVGVALLGGAVTLLVGGMLGAFSKQFTQGGRAGFVVAAVLAALVLLTVLVVGPVAAAQAPICGVAAAGPGLFALRTFVMWRDGTAA